MTFLPRRHQIAQNATFTTAGSTYTFSGLANLGRSENPTAILVVDIQNAPTGTSPSMTITVLGRPNADTGYRYEQIYQLTAQTAQLTAPIRQVIQNVLEADLEVTVAVTGASGSFTGVYIDLLLTSPDA